jgi:putative FmdB family regulatory protein
MPIYEYRCGSCEQRFEELLASSTGPSPPCPACGASEVTRVYSHFATEWKPSLVNWHRMPGKW